MSVIQWTEDEYRPSLAERFAQWFRPAMTPELMAIDSAVVASIEQAGSEAAMSPVERAKAAKQKLIDAELNEVEALEARIFARDMAEQKARLVMEATAERIAAENEADRAAISEHYAAIAELQGSPAPVPLPAQRKKRA